MNNRYSFSELVKIVYSLIMTKLTIHQARIIRRPVYIRGEKSISGGRNLTMGRFCRFDLKGDKKTLFIGSDCEFGDMTHIVAYDRVEIGDNVLIASKCFISDTNHGSYKGNEQSDPNEPPKRRKLVTKATRIGNNVWMGENVVVLAGADIGDGCVIGANSVVNSIIPSMSIAAGTPAKVIKYYEDENKKWISGTNKEGSLNL